MRILLLSRWFPFPADNGAKIRIYNLIRTIASRHQVRLISFASEPVDEARLREMQTYCYKVETELYRPFQSRSLKARLGLFSPIPRSFLDTHNPAFLAKVEQAGREEKFDLVLGSAWDSIPYLLGAPALSKTPKLLEEVEISIYRDQYLHAKSQSQKLRKRLMWSKWRYYMGRSLRRINACTVVSEPEIEPIHECLPGYGPIGVIPNGADIARFTGDFGAPQPNTIVYTGAMTYHVNFEAMKWFLGEIWPRITAEVPQAQLFMCGRTEGVPVHELPNYPNVTLVGHLADVRPRIAQSWLSIVPERTGGGTRIKVPEAMALGTPVVCTVRGATGLDLTHGHDVLIADRAADFAEAVVRVLKDPQLRQTLSKNGRATVEAKYDWRIIGQQLDDFMLRLVNTAPTN